jgi:hypothetical protein
MIKKIIVRWQRRYQKFYTSGHWRLVLDLGIILIILILLLALWLIDSWRPLSDHRSLINPGSINHKPTSYQTMPLDWQVKFKPVVISETNERLTAEIVYKNKADQAMAVSYICYPDGAERALSIQEASDGRFSWLDGQLATALLSGQSGQLTVVWNWQNQPEVFTKQIKIICFLQAKLASQNWFQPQQEFIFKKAGSVRVSAGAYFYTVDGDQVGVGPIPPIVGLPTSYLVTWTLENIGGDLTDVQFAAQLADNATWQGEAGLTGGNLSYDATNRKVNWRIAEWSDDAPQKQASFYVAINPTKEMIGQLVPLIQVGQWRANDSWSEKVWQGELPALTSNLDYDNHSKGQGQVRDWLER